MELHKRKTYRDADVYSHIRPDTQHIIRLTRTLWLPRLHNTDYMYPQASTTSTPAILYFPAGTYLISSSIIPYYFTQMVGDASSPPTLKATANFQGFGLIDGNPYWTENLNWVSTNVFYRQVRNFVLDTTNIAPATEATGIHWPTSQATSLQNIVFNMPVGNGVVHVGLFIESGSCFLGPATTAHTNRECEQGPAASCPT